MKKILLLLFAVIASVIQSQVVTILNQTYPTCTNTCNGSVTFSISGSAFPYNVSIASPAGCTTVSPMTITSSTFVVSGLCACSSFYTFVFFDSFSSFVDSKSVTMTAPALVALGTTTNATCGANGCILAFASGGIAPYTYSWQPAVISGSSACGLPAGGYTLNVTDGNGCLAIKFFSVAQTPASFSVSTVGTGSAICGGANGSASVSISGTTAPYTYSWSTSPVQTSSFATGLSGGNYTVVVSDNSNVCLNHTLTVPSISPSILNMYGYAPSCFGASNGTISTYAYGNPGFTYTWSPGGMNTATITNIGAGPYSCTITDAYGCNTTNSLIIYQPSPVSLTLTSVSPNCQGCCNGSISYSASGGAGFYTYSISNGAVTSGTTISSLCSGVYTVNVTDWNGCLSSGTVIVASGPTGIIGNILESDIDIFPNPTSDIFTILNKLNVRLNLFVYNSEGNLVLKIENISETKEVNSESLRKGIYFLKLHSANAILSKKLMIE